MAWIVIVLQRAIASLPRHASWRNPRVRYNHTVFCQRPVDCVLWHIILALKEFESWADFWQLALPPHRKRE